MLAEQPAENGTISLPETMNIVMVNPKGMGLVNEKDVTILKLKRITPGICFLKKLWRSAGQDCYLKRTLSVVKGLQPPF